MVSMCDGAVEDLHIWNSLNFDTLDVEDVIIVASIPFAYS